MAKKMKVPIGRLSAGVNVNDVTWRFIRTGVLEKDDQPMKKTLSEAINIQVPYNLERLLFYLTSGNYQQVQQWYQSLESCGRLELSQFWLSKLKEEFRSVRVDDTKLCATLQEVLDGMKYWADPHTGVAFAAAKELNYLGKQSKPVALLATASPCKFEETISEALGKEKWNEYVRKHFPSHGLELCRKSEVSPIIYLRDSEKSLEENQKEWEQLAREIVMSL